MLYSLQMFVDNDQSAPAVPTAYIPCIRGYTFWSLFVIITSQFCFMTSLDGHFFGHHDQLVIID